MGTPLHHSKSYKKVCPICGKEFTANTALQKYCDAVCGYEASLIRQREYNRRKKAAEKNGNSNS